VTSNSVFDGLSNREFSRCHLVTASAHYDSLVVSADDDESTEVYSFVSSANWRYDILKKEISRKTGVVKIQGGSRTEPCGTPVVQPTVVEWQFPRET